MKKIVCTTIIIFFVNPLLSSFGQETKKIDKNLENISGQYAECSAYFRLVYFGLISSNAKKKSASSYLQLADTAMIYSIILASEGRSEELADQVTKSRIKMYMKKMNQEAKGRNENISILIDKYHFGCQEAMENPSSQLVEILSKIE